MKKNSFLFIIALLLLFSLSACNCVLIEKDSVTQYKPINQAQEEDVKVQILSYTGICNGIIYDYIEDYSRIIFAQNTSSDENEVLNLFNYNTETKKDEAYIADIKDNIDAKYDSVSNGIYYVEYNKNTNTSRIMWTDLNNKITTGITDLINSQDLCWYLTKDGNVLYAAGDGRIYFADKNGVYNIYNISSNVTIKKIGYLPKDKNVVFLSHDTQTNSNILYRMSLAEDKKTLIPMELNITDFETDENNDKIAYIKTNSTGLPILYSYDFNTGIKHQIYKGNIQKISLSPNGKYCAIITNPTDSLPIISLWLLSTDNDFKPSQLVVNINPIGNINWSKTKNDIYFSVTEENNEKNEYSIMKLNFRLKNDVKRQP